MTRMTERHQKLPGWLIGPSIVRAIVVTAIGISLMFFDAIVIGRLFEELPATLAMIGAIIAMLGSIDFFISLFTILGRRKNRSNE